MAHTFFIGTSSYSQDEVTLTRFCGQGQNSRCLQLSTRRYKESLDCPASDREQQFLPGHSYVCLSLDEAVALRDNLTRFILNQVPDGASVGDFERAMTTKEYAALKGKFPSILKRIIKAQGS